MLLVVLTIPKPVEAIKTHPVMTAKPPITANSNPNPIRLLNSAVVKKVQPVT